MVNKDLCYVVFGGTGFVGSMLTSFLRDNSLKFYEFDRWGVEKTSDGSGSSVAGTHLSDFVESHVSAFMFRVIFCSCALNTNRKAEIANTDLDLFYSQSQKIISIFSRVECDVFFLNSTHTFFYKNSYTDHKLKTSELLRSADNIRFFDLYLGAVHDTHVPVAAFPLRRIPSRYMKIFYCFRPTTSLNLITDFVLTVSSDMRSGRYLILDKKYDEFWYSIFSSLMNFCFVIVGFPIFVLCLIPVGVLIKIDSAGPIFYSQTRAGKFGRPFRILKFRTMKEGVAVKATHLISSSGISRIGRFLRKWKIDELPQVVNVFRGQMGLVGYRPCLLSQVDLIEARRKIGISQELPGITGLGQVTGFDMADVHSLIEVERKYMNLRCVSLDIRICVSTFFGALARFRQINLSFIR